MKFRAKFLLASLALLMIQAASAQTRATAPVSAVVRLPLGDTLPQPGALALSADASVAAHIGIAGEIVIWDVTRSKVLETIPADGRKPSAVAFGRDDDLLAIGYADAQVILRSRKAHKTLREFRGHTAKISALAFSPDGQTLASGAADATSQLWDIGTGQRLHIFDSLRNDDISDGGGIPVAIGFSGNGKVLLVNEWYSRFYDVGRGSTLWDLDSGMEMSTREVAPPNEDNFVRAGQALGARGWLLAYTGEKGLMAERVDRCEAPRRLPAGGFADTVAADPQGRWVAASSSGKITFFGLITKGKGLAVQLPAKVLALTPLPDGRSVIAMLVKAAQHNGNEDFIAGRDEESVTRGRLYRIAVPETLLNQVSVAVGSEASHCPLSASAHALQDFRRPDPVPEPEIIAKLLPPKEMRIDPAEPASPNNRVNSVRELYFSGDDKLYALHLGDYGLRSGVAIWNTQTKQLLQARFGRYSSDIAVMRLRDGWAGFLESLTNLSTGTTFYQPGNMERQDRTTEVADPDTGEVFRKAKGHIERYSAAGQRLPDIRTAPAVTSFTARNGRLAVLYKSGKVQVWQLQPHGETKVFKQGLAGDEPWPELLGMSADGRYLQVVFPNGSGDGPDEFSVFRLGSVKPVGRGEMLTGFPARANRGVVLDTRPHHLAVWDYDKGTIIARLPRHRSRGKNGEIKPLVTTISDDGQLVASASPDGLVRIWDLGMHRMVVEGHAGGSVSALAFDSAGGRLAAGREDGQIIVFLVPGSK